MVIYAESWIMLSVAIWIIIRGSILLIRKIRNKKFSIKKEVIINLFVIYIICLIGATLLPIQIGAHRPPINSKADVNLIPLVDIIREFKETSKEHYLLKILIQNIFGNFILLMPLGVFALILWEKLRSFRYYVLLGFLTSLTIEVMQFVESYLRISMYPRVSDIDDIILNTLGFIVVYILLKKVILKLNIIKHPQSQEHA